MKIYRIIHAQACRNLRHFISAVVPEAEQVVPTYSL